MSALTLQGRPHTDQGILILGPGGNSREYRAYCNLCHWKASKAWAVGSVPFPKDFALADARAHARAHG